MKRIILTVLVCACAFGGGLTSVALVPRLVPVVSAQQRSSVILPAPNSDIVLIGDRFELIARRVSPAVVSVEATKPSSPSNGTTGKARPVEESGSGVLIRAENRPGYLVLTNNHVISQAKPDQITVNLADGRLLHPVQVWADPESDVAVLRLETKEELPTVALGNSDQARVGQWVLAIGSPFGLNQTVTHGIISARERGQVSLGSTIRIKDFLQTDAAINPGSSGGPLVNLDGEVIGLNTAIASQSGSNSGVAFSIPVNLVKRVMRQRAQGAKVETIYPDTPAAAAGLRANDILLEVDGQPIRNENHLINYISDLPAGQKVKLQIWRDRKTLVVEAAVGDWSKANARFRAGQ